MNQLNNKNEILLMYLEWAKRDLMSGRPALPVELRVALKRYGERKADYFDQQHAIQMMVQLQQEGRTAVDSYAEIAKRLRRSVRSGPSERLIQKWWEERRKHSHLLSDDLLARKPGRPRRKRTS